MNLRFNENSSDSGEERKRSSSKMAMRRLSGSTELYVKGFPTFLNWYVIKLITSERKTEKIVVRETFYVL